MAESSRPPVCILGMHRSGTSLTAAVVERLGINLGPPESMLPPDERENPLGYFEQRAIRALNNDILRALGGSWWKPPRPAPGWDADPALDRLYARAAEVRDGLFGGGMRWGVKDPRLCLTLPFWRRLVGEASCVVCVRAAPEVAASLRHRYTAGSHWKPPLHPLRRQDWGALTDLYTADAMRETRRLPRIVVTFDEWFTRPGDAIERLSRFLELPATPELERHALRAIDPRLRHHGPDPAASSCERPTAAATA